MRRSGSPKPRPPGSFPTSSVNTLPSVASTTIRAVVSVKKASDSRSSPLNDSPTVSATWPLSVRIHPFSDTTTVTGSRSMKLCAVVDASSSGSASNVVRRRPSGVSAP